MSPCALCRLKKPLVESHIFPRFVIEEAEDQLPAGKHGHTQPYLTLVDYDSTKPIYCKRRTHALRKEGFVEHLLCADCDQRLIGVAESYVRKRLFGAGPKLTHIRPAKYHVKYVTTLGRVVRQGLEQRWVDYEQFKRFQISILWRASVASGIAFKEAHHHIPAVAKEQMRMALMSGVFDENLIPCVMERLDGFESENFGIIQRPMYGINVNKDAVIQLIFGGYRWNFFLNARNLPKRLLTKSGQLEIIVWDIKRLYTPDEMLRARLT